MNDAELLNATAKFWVDNGGSGDSLDWFVEHLIDKVFELTGEQQQYNRDRIMEVPNTW